MAANAISGRYLSSLLSLSLSLSLPLFCALYLYLLIHLSISCRISTSVQIILAKNDKYLCKPNSAHARGPSSPASND